MSGRRKTLRQKSVHQRAAGMDAGEVVFAKRLLTMAVLNVMSGGEEEPTFVSLTAWCCVTCERKIERPRFPILRRTIESVGESESYTNFRFSRDQLRVVKDALGFPDELQAGNGRHGSCLREALRPLEERAGAVCRTLRDVRRKNPRSR